MPPPFSALRSLPWGTILRQAPVLIAAAERLLATSRGRQQDSAVAGDLEGLRRQLAALDEEHQRALVVVRQLADQTAALSSAAEALEARMRAIRAIAFVAVVIAAAAIAIALLR